MQSDATLRMVAGLAELYGRELSPEALALYGHALSHLTPDEVALAGERWLATGRRMPTPADLLDTLDDGAETPASAWLDIVAGRPVSTLAAAALEDIGGRRRLRGLLVRDVEWIGREYHQAYVRRRRALDPAARVRHMRETGALAEGTQRRITSA